MLRELQLLISSSGDVMIVRMRHRRDEQAVLEAAGYPVIYAERYPGIKVMDDLSQQVIGESGAWVTVYAAWDYSNIREAIAAELRARQAKGRFLNVQIVE